MGKFTAVKKFLLFGLAGIFAFSLFGQAVAEGIFGQTSSGVQMLKKKAITVLNLTQGGTTVTAIPVNGTTTVYTDVFTISDVDFTTLGARATSAGTVNCTITLEQGAFNVATPGAADSGWALSSTSLAINDTTQRYQAIELLSLPYGRFKITGQGSNGNTVMAVLISTQNSQ